MTFSLGICIIYGSQFHCLFFITITCRVKIQAIIKSIIIMLKLILMDKNILPFVVSVMSILTICGMTYTRIRW